MSSTLPRLTQLHPQAGMLCTNLGRTVLATDPDGFISGLPGEGLFVHQTRVLSRYRYLVDGRKLHAAAASNVAQHSALLYFAIPYPLPRVSRFSRTTSTEHVLEMRLARFVGEGCHEEVHLTNYAQAPAQFRLQLEADADFADLKETEGKRKQRGTRTCAWRQIGAADWELRFDYTAEHPYRHQDDSGVARLHRGLVLHVARATSPPSYKDGRLTFAVSLEPGARWHACVDLVPLIDGNPLQPAHAGGSFGGAGNEYEDKRSVFLADAIAFRAPGTDTLTPLVVRTLDQARHDLSDLRLHDLDEGEHCWTVAAGVPAYVGLFGRDVLLTAWQAALVTSDLLRGALTQLPRWQGSRVNNWRDEQPGRMVHQVQDAPLSVLNFNPFGRYYGTMSSGLLYCEALFALWLWTADKELVGRFLEPARQAIAWLDEYGDLDGDGFYEYKTRSSQGLKNQTWKDSGEAIVYEDGRQVPDPIAAAETQALAYLAKGHLAEVLDALGRGEEARRLQREAAELRQRFNDVFWMEEEGYYALGLDPQKRLIRSVDSGAGGCLAAGIVEGSRAGRVADRLLTEDLYSGWGVRTLSARHPAYNPFSYQRGSVWPVENGLVALGLVRYGLHGHVARVCRGMFEAAALFEHCRLPEVFAGHPRDDDHPFPGLYPRANWPQAWSASAVFSLVQALLGIFPYAPLHALVVDPQLPDWLPELTLSGLRVGEGSVSIRFSRKADGNSDYEILDKRGKLHVVRQPSPWSLSAGLGERLRDVVQSLMPSGW